MHRCTLAADSTEKFLNTTCSSKEMSTEQKTSNEKISQTTPELHLSESYEATDLSTESIYI